MTKVVLETPFVYEKLGAALRVRGVALAPGTYKGCEGPEVTYTLDVLKEAAPTLLGKPIVYPHTLSEADVPKQAVGFVSAVMCEDALEFEGYIYNPDIVKLVEEGKLNGFSIEGQVDLEFLPESGTFRAERLELQALALTESPACSACRVLSVEPVELEQEPEGGECEMEENTAAPGRVELQTTIASLPEVVESKLREAGVDDRTIALVKEIIKNALSSIVVTTYPYPYPQPAQTKQEETEAEPDKLAELTARLEELEKELNTVKAERDQLLQEKVDALVAEIRKIDKRFEPAKLGIEDKKALIPMLQSYLESLRRVAKPVKLEVDDTQTKAEAVKKLVLEMFGGGEW